MPKSAGGRLLSGDCVELGEGELPYAPIVAALRPLARDGDPALDALPDGARAELTRLLPGLGLPSLPPIETEDVGAAQSRLFEALLSLLEELGSEHAVVLMIEDLHWADRSTRNFLDLPGAQPVPRARAGRRLLPPRRAAPPPSAAPAAGRARARRARAPDRARRRSRRGELAEALGDILGAPPDDDLVDRLYTRSEGNPLFAEELLAAGLDGRGALPPTLREALMLRIEALAADRAGAAAAAGRRPAHGPRADRGGQRASTRARSARRCARRSPATSSSPTTRASTASATRCCARSSTTTCCPASTPSCTARSRARSRSARGATAAAARTARPRSPTTTWPPATSPPRFAASVRAADVVDGRAGPRRGGRPARARDRALQPRPGRRARWRAATAPS